MTSCDYRETREYLVPYWHALKLAQSDLGELANVHLYLIQGQRKLVPMTTYTVSLAIHWSPGHKGYT